MKDLPKKSNEWNANNTKQNLIRFSCENQNKLSANCFSWESPTTHSLPFHLLLSRKGGNSQRTLPPPNTKKSTGTLHRHNFPSAKRHTKGGPCTKTILAFILSVHPPPLTSNYESRPHNRRRQLHRPLGPPPCQHPPAHSSRR